MFKRPFWDPPMMDLAERFYRKPVMPQDKPGYRLQDQPLVNTSWRLENEFAQGVCGGRMGCYDWSWGGHYNFPRLQPLPVRDIPAWRLRPACCTIGCDGISRTHPG